MRKPYVSLFYGIFAIAFVFSGAVQAQDEFEGPGVELIGSGSCVFWQESTGEEGTFDQVRVPARRIVQKHPGVTLSDVVIGSCTTFPRAVKRGTKVPLSIYDLPDGHPLIKCHNVSARSECFGDWSQEVMINGAVRVDCICSEDPL
ncbi:MAG: hypothetical protein JSW39_16300 [Desulfobacterales bacterium]|nr:MAG: hypothetical protein JSW39_16300 [Desulfobacterales bacterium]